MTDAVQPSLDLFALWQQRSDLSAADLQLLQQPDFVTSTLERFNVLLKLWNSDAASLHLFQQQAIALQTALKTHRAELSAKNPDFHRDVRMIDAIVAEVNAQCQSYAQLCAQLKFDSATQRFQLASTTSAKPLQGSGATARKSAPRAAIEPKPVVSASTAPIDKSTAVSKVRGPRKRSISEIESTPLSELISSSDDEDRASKRVKVNEAAVIAEVPQPSSTPIKKTRAKAAAATSPDPSHASTAAKNIAASFTSPPVKTKKSKAKSANAIAEMQDDSKSALLAFADQVTNIAPASPSHAHVGIISLSDATKSAVSSPNSHAATSSDDSDD